MIAAAVRRNAIPTALLVIYGLISFLTLAVYPAVHSDEVWLASLTRSMIVERSVAAREDFFAITPRYPHAIKTLYHLIQAPFIAIEFSHVAARLPSAIAGLVAVAFMWYLILRITHRRILATIIALAFAVDPQVVYITHFARQEAMILAIIIIGMAVSIGLHNGTPESTETRRRIPFVVGLLVGIAIFIHPNAFIAAAALLPWVLRATLVDLGDQENATHNGDQVWRRAVPAVGVYAIPMIVCAAAAVGASFLMNPQFLSQYTSFGRSVGVGDSVLRRLFRLRFFFQKVITQNESTYYLPRIASRMYLASGVAAIGGILSLFKNLRHRRVANALISTSASIGSVVIAFFIIGKYSPPSIVFLFPFVYLGLALILGMILPPNRGPFENGRRGVALCVLVLGASLPVVDGIREYPEEIVLPGRVGSYDRYIQLITDSIPPLVGDERVLANLNTGFAFGPEKLRAYRDFGALTRDESITIEAYIETERIRYVLLPTDELSLIYRSRPVWNEIYGNPTRFYQQLRTVIEDRGTKAGDFVAPRYGMRLLRYQERYPGTVEVYRLDAREHQP